MDGQDAQDLVLCSVAANNKPFIAPTLIGVRLNRLFD